jgi:hypothetical protein
MEINAEYRAVAERFAEAIVEKDYEAAHRCFAAWLRDAVTVDAFREIVEREVRETLEANDMPATLHPADYRVGWNASTLDELKDADSWAPGRDIPEEITPDNFRQWLHVLLQPDADEESEIDAYTDVWMIVVETARGHEIGYFEVAEPD